MSTGLIGEILYQLRQMCYRFDKKIFRMEIRVIKNNQKEKPIRIIKKKNQKEKSISTINKNQSKTNQKNQSIRKTVNKNKKDINNISQVIAIGEALWEFQKPKFLKLII